MGSLGREEGGIIYQGGRDTEEDETLWLSREVSSDHRRSRVDDESGIARRLWRQAETGKIREGEVFSGLSGVNDPFLPVKGELSENIAFSCSPAYNFK